MGRYHLICFGFYIADVTEPVGYVLRHLGFEGVVADEDDKGVDLMVMETQKVDEIPDVFVVLTQWVREFIRPAVYLLRPMLVMHGSVNLAPHIHSFDDENAIYGDNDLIDRNAALLGG